MVNKCVNNMKEIQKQLQKLQECQKKLKKFTQRERGNRKSDIMAGTGMDLLHQILTKQQ